MADRPKRPTWKAPAVAAAVFLAVFFAHFLSPVRTPADSLLTLPRAMSVLAHGDTDLDEYRVVPYWNDVRYMLEHPIRGHDYCMYPIGPSLVALPFVAAEDGWWRLRHGTSYEERLKQAAAMEFEAFIASLCVATAALFLFLAVRRKTGRAWPALLVVIAFAFGTTAWSIASRALWQHGPSMMFLSVALYLLVVAETRASVAQFVSLPLAAAYVCRPTNAVPVIILSLFVLYKYRREFWKYALWSLAIAVPFVAFNWNLYGGPLSPYYTPQALRLPAPFWMVFCGHMISPARGLLIFSPVLLLGLAGLAIKVREKRFDALDAAIAAIVLAHWVVISKMGWAWWGGHSFGPRFFTDVLPFFAWFLVPVAEKMIRPWHIGRVALSAAFFLLLAASVAIHWSGAARTAVWDWNSVPTNVDKNTERLWDWRDLQFLRTESTPASSPASPGTPERIAP